MGKESRRATVCIEAINQAGQHCYDTGQAFLFRGERDRSRRNLWRPTHQGRRRTRMPSRGRHRKTWPAVDPDACRFLRRCSEAPRDLHGQVVRSTPVDAGPINSRHHPRIKQIINLFVNREFLTMLLLLQSLSVGVVAKGWTDGRRATTIGATS